MKFKKISIVLLVAISFVMTSSIISYAVTNQTYPTGKGMKHKGKFNMNGNANFSGFYNSNNTTSNGNNPDNSSSSTSDNTTANSNDTTSDNTSNDNTSQSTSTPNINTSDTDTNSTEINTNVSDAELQTEIQTIQNQINDLLMENQKTAEQIDTKKSQVDEYISCMRDGSIVYSDDNLTQINTLMSTLTSDAQLVKADNANIQLIVQTANSFTNDEDFKNELIELNTELSTIKTSSVHLISVNTDLTNMLTMLVNGQSVGSIIDEPTASPTPSTLVTSNTVN
jgi:hypothetical protein